MSKLERKIRGTDGDDEIKGTEGNDKIKAGDGDDLVFGNDGRDLIIGNGGNDLIRGGRGDDTLAGGRGADVFFFDAGDGRDVVRGFKPGEDKIVLCTDGTVTLTEDFWGTTITYDGGTIRLVGVHEFNPADLVNGY